jgi:hypothetical protein
VPALIVALVALLAAAPAAEAKRKAKPKPPRVLVYSGTVGFHHQSIPFGNAVLARLARLTKRYRVSFIEKPEELTAERLARPTSCCGTTPPAPSLRSPTSSRRRT